MSVVGINEARIAPVSEDLTTPFTNLEILRGLEKMHRVDYKVAPGVSLKAGEYAVLGNDNQLVRASGTPSASALLVFRGTDGFDSKATGQATVIEASALVVKTDLYNTAPSYAVGDLLVAKNIGGGESFVTKATAGEWAIGRVREVGSGYLVYDYFAQTVKA